MTNEPKPHGIDETTGRSCDCYSCKDWEFVNPDVEDDDYDDRPIEDQYADSDGPDISE